MTSSIFDSYAQSLNDRAKSEIRIWAMLGTGSLALAGVFALLLAFSRIPGSENLIGWPAGFFAKGLVIHVIFSFVVWFLTVYALLATLATFKLSFGHTMRLAGLGRLGVILVALAFPLLFLPAFASSGEASLNNYIPVIIGVVYYVGLGVLALGILAPVIRLFANMHVSWRDMDFFSAAMVAGGVIYIMALVIIAIAAAHVAGEAPSEIVNEELFWGGGHVLQFLNTGMLVAGWVLLLRLSVGENIVGEGMVKLGNDMLAMFVLPAPLLFIMYEAFSFEQNMAFTNAQYVLGIPVLIVAISAISGLSNRARNGGLPWENTAFLAAMLAPPVFLAGGILGFFVDGADTRTPAHYHGMIAGVNLVMMGLFLSFVLPLIDRAPQGPRKIRAQLYMFGIGQFVACIGLFWAGGYGAARKTAGASQGLVDGAMIGMMLNGIGALIAVIGGIMFIWTVLSALMRVPHSI